MNADLVRKLINFFGFQLGWLACVLFASSPLIVIGVTLGILLLHGFVVIQDKREWWVIAAVVLLGASVDSVLGLLGVLVYPGNVLLPLWLLCLWILFATLINHSFAWLRYKYWVASVLAATSAPVSYWAGASLTGTEFGFAPFISLAIIGACWAVIFPFSLWISIKVLGNEVDPHYESI